MEFYHYTLYLTYRYHNKPLFNMYLATTSLKTQRRHFVGGHVVRSNKQANAVAVGRGRVGRQQSLRIGEHRFATVGVWIDFNFWDNHFIVSIIVKGSKTSVTEKAWIFWCQRTAICYPSEMTKHSAINESLTSVNKFAKLPDCTKQLFIYDDNVLILGTKLLTN